MSLTLMEFEVKVCTHIRAIGGNHSKRRAVPHGVIVVINGFDLPGGGGIAHRKVLLDVDYGLHETRSVVVDVIEGDYQCGSASTTRRVSCQQPIEMTLATNATSSRKVCQITHVPGKLVIAQKKH